MGLRGAAVEPGTNIVTINSLASFVQAKSPQSQQPVLLGQFQRLVLTRPVESLVSSNFSNTFFQDKSGRDALEISPLPNSIEKEIEFIDVILNNLQQVEDTTRLNVSDRILEAMRRSIDAEIVFVESADKEDFSIKNKYVVAKDSRRSSKKEADIRDETLRQIHSVIFGEKDKLLESRYGLFKKLDGFNNKGKNIILIPLNLDYPREFQIFSGVPNKNLDNGELMGQIYISLYKATLEFTLIDTLGIENALLDDIRTHFGFVPIEIYNRRLKNFILQLEKVKFAYEPIISLGKRNPQINSWEALARDPATGRAPAALFKAAQLWGTRYVRILDLYCLSNATKSYYDIWKSERGQTNMDTLSVNVFPKTIYHPDYYLEIERIVNKEDLLKGRGLVLEISEQQPIPYIVSKSNKEESMSYFEKQLHEYHDKFDVSFAIDDFGSGYASIGRMTKLELNHIKIDREILSQKFPLETIKYVIKTVRSMHKYQNTNIVVEGYDGLSRGSLAEMFNVGIKYVQGHLLRRASETVRNLDEDETRFIVDSLNSEKQKPVPAFEDENQEI